MNIMEVLKSDENVRLSIGQKWIVWSVDSLEVYKNGRISARLIFRTHDEEKAVQCLLK